MFENHAHLRSITLKKLLLTFTLAASNFAVASNTDITKQDCPSASTVASASLSQSLAYDKNRYVAYQTSPTSNNGYDWHMGVANVSAHDQLAALNKAKSNISKTAALLSFHKDENDRAICLYAVPFTRTIAIAETGVDLSSITSDDLLDLIMSLTG